MRPVLLVSLVLLSLLWRALLAPMTAPSQSQQRSGALMAVPLVQCLTVRRLFQLLIVSAGVIFYFGSISRAMSVSNSHDHYA